jgi:8-oxo-dGTP pyrophosphatase MutT (NUDIX family)
MIVGMARSPLTPSAVLVPVFRDTEGELRIVLVRRAPGGPHGGQLGLPGGRCEPDDGSLLETALRETEEEIGLPPEDVEIIAELDPLETRTSGFLVHPFLAVIRPPAEWRLAADEITGVITPTLSMLAAADARVERELESRLVECIQLGEDPPLWGLTLRLLDELLPRLVGGEWQL